MPSIVVSYRRADSAGTAGRIFDELVPHFGRENVFMDIDNIPLGIDYRHHIKDILCRTGILLVIIGPRWLSERLLYEEEDFVRIEIQTALENKVIVIPVLVDYAKMPNGGDLPESIREISFLNAAEVSPGRDFHVHMERLIHSIQSILLPDNSFGHEEPEVNIKQLPLSEAANLASDFVVDHLETAELQHLPAQFAVVGIISGLISSFLPVFSHSVFGFQLFGLAPDVGFLFGICLAAAIYKLALVTPSYRLILIPFISALVWLATLKFGNMFPSVESEPGSTLIGVGIWAISGAVF